jgi:hypothetical protein
MLVHQHGGQQNTTSMTSSDKRIVFLKQKSIYTLISNLCSRRLAGHARPTLIFLPMETPRLASTRRTRLELNAEQPLECRDAK